VRNNSNLKQPMANFLRVCHYKTGDGKWKMENGNMADSGGFVFTD